MGRDLRIGLLHSFHLFLLVSQAFLLLPHEHVYGEVDSERSNCEQTLAQSASRVDLVSLRPSSMQDDVIDALCLSAAKLHPEES